MINIYPYPFSKQVKSLPDPPPARPREVKEVQNKKYLNDYRWLIDAINNLKKCFHLCNACSSKFQCMKSQVGSSNVYYECSLSGHSHKSPSRDGSAEEQGNWPTEPQEQEEQDTKHNILKINPRQAHSRSAESTPNAADEAQNKVIVFSNSLTETKEDNLSFSDDVYIFVDDCTRQESESGLNRGLSRNINSQILQDQSSNLPGPATDRAFLHIKRHFKDSMAYFACEHIKPSELFNRSKSDDYYRIDIYAYGTEQLGSMDDYLLRRNGSGECIDIPELEHLRHMDEKERIKNLHQLYKNSINRTANRYLPDPHSTDSVDKSAQEKFCNTRADSVQPSLESTKAHSDSTHPRSNSNLLQSTSASTRGQLSPGIETGKERGNCHPPNSIRGKVPVTNKSKGSGPPHPSMYEPSQMPPTLIQELTQKLLARKQVFGTDRREMKRGDTDTADDCADDCADPGPADKPNITQSLEYTLHKIKSGTTDQSRRTVNNVDIDEFTKKLSNGLQMLQQMQTAHSRDHTKKGNPEKAMVMEYVQLIHDKEKSVGSPIQFGKCLKELKKKQTVRGNSKEVEYEGCQGKYPTAPIQSNLLIPSEIPNYSLINDLKNKLKERSERRRSGYPHEAKINTEEERHLSDYDCNELDNAHKTGAINERNEQDHILKKEGSKCSAISEADRYRTHSGLLDRGNKCANANQVHRNVTKERNDTMGNSKSGVSSSVQFGKPKMEVREVGKMANRQCTDTPPNKYPNNAQTDKCRATERGTAKHLPLDPTNRKVREIPFMKTFASDFRNCENHKIKNPIKEFTNESTPQRFPTGSGSFLNNTANEISFNATDPPTTESPDRRRDRQNLSIATAPMSNSKCNMNGRKSETPGILRKHSSAHLGNAPPTLKTNSRDNWTNTVSERREGSADRHPHNMLTARSGSMTNLARTPSEINVYNNVYTSDLERNNPSNKKVIYFNNNYFFNMENEQADRRKSHSNSGLTYNFKKFGVEITHGGSDSYRLQYLSNSLESDTHDFRSGSNTPEVAQRAEGAEGGNCQGGCAPMLDRRNSCINKRMVELMNRHSSKLHKLKEKEKATKIKEAATNGQSRKKGLKDMFLVPSSPKMQEKIPKPVNSQLGEASLSYLKKTPSYPFEDYQF